MYITDFYYDGRKLSDLGFTVCEFGGESDGEVADAGAQLTFNTVSMHGGKYHSLTGTQYDNCLTATFYICKQPCSHPDMQITHTEWRELVIWLSRPQFCEFSAWNQDAVSEMYYCDATFNIKKYMIGGILYGAELTMTTNRPYCYGAEQTISHTITAEDNTFQILNISDELGYFYPTLTVTCTQAGNLKITNKFADCETVINNCSLGETIVLSGSTQMIETTSASHNICNDFNFDFFRLTRTYSEIANEITVSLPCLIEIKYKPIVKDSY